MTDPVTFFDSLGIDAAMGSVLSWIAVALSAGMGLVFVGLSLRKGVSFFMNIVEERRFGPVIAEAKQRQEAAVLDMWESFEIMRPEGTYHDFEGFVYLNARSLGLTDEEAQDSANNAREIIEDHRRANGTY